MKLAWHIAKKDFRRLWPLLALWWGMLVLGTLFPAMDSRHNFDSTQTWPWDYKAYQNTMRYWEVRFFALEAWNIILLLVIGAAAIRADSPIKTFAHWRTLPQSGRRIFGAKILFFAVFCVLPAALVNLVEKIAYGFPLAELFAGLGWYEWKIVACLALGVMPSALFRRPFLTVAGVLAFYCLCVVLFDLSDYWFLGMPNIWPLFQNNEASLNLSSFIVWSNLWLAMIVGVVACQYLTRRGWPAYVILILGVVLAQTAQGVWTFDFMAPYSYLSLSLPNPEPVAADTLQVVSPGQQKAGPIKSEIECDWVVSGLRTRQPGEAWFPLWSKWTTEDSDGKKSSDSEFSWASAWGNNADFPLNEEGVLKALGFTGLQKGKYLNWTDNKFSPGNQLSGLKIIIPPHAVPKNSPAKLTGEYILGAGTLSRIVDIPAIPSAQFARTPDIFKITSIHFEPRNDFDIFRLRKPAVIAHPSVIMISVDLLLQSLTSAQLPLAANRDPWPMIQQGVSMEPINFYILWNPQRRQTLPAVQSYNVGARTWIPTSAHNFGSGLDFVTYPSSLIFQFYPSDGAAETSIQEAQAWLADARLVKLRFTPERLFTVPVSIDLVTPPPSSATPPAP